VRGVVDHDVLAVVAHFVRACAGRFDRQDAVRGPVHEKRRHVDLSQVRAKVGLPGWRAGPDADRRVAGGYVPAISDGLLADALAEEYVEVVEVVVERRQRGEASAAIGAWTPSNTLWSRPFGVS
jgi:hypothetical protein